jgi:hypothetical protein
VWYIPFSVLNHQNLSFEFVNMTITRIYCYLFGQVCHKNNSPIREQSTSPAAATANYVCASLNRVDSVRRRQLSRMRKRSAWFETSSQRDNADDELASANHNQSWSNDDSDGITSECKSQDFLCAPALEPADSASHVDSSAALLLPQLCINDIAASESDSTDPASALVIDMSGLQSAHTDNNLFRSTTDHNRSSAVFDGSSIERLSSVASRSSVGSEARNPPPTSADDIQSRTIENNMTELALTSSDDSRHALASEVHWLHTLGENSLIDRASTRGQSAELGDAVPPSVADGSCRPSSADITAADHLPLLEARYFVVERLYGSKPTGKTNGGNF